MKNRVQFIRILLLLNTISLKILAQDSSQEFWPELDVWYKLNPSWRASVLIPLSRNIETNYRKSSFLYKPIILGKNQSMAYSCECLTMIKPVELKII